MGLLDIINAAGAGAQSGGCWTAFGSNSNCSFNYSQPITLEIGGVPGTYGLDDLLPGGDNPEITDWDCASGDTCFGLIYRCSNNISGCSCPSGLCPRAVFYQFNASGCCCPLPCAGDFIECTFFHDYGFTISSASSSDITMTSFIVDGTQYVSTPVVLPSPNIITIGGFSYNTAFADLINSIGVPNFTSSYPTSAQISSAHSLVAGSVNRNGVVRIKHPDCLNFEIIITDTANGGSTHTWNNSGYTDDTSTNNLYVSSAPFDCVNTNEC